jgi:VWFA-related protein
MNRFVICLALVFVSTFLVIGQDTRPAGTPPVLKGDVPAGDAARPALKGSGTQPTTPPSSAKAGSADDEIIKVETNLVTTPVSVLDRSGRFIPNLKQKDFSIFENGVPQKITYFQSSEQPFTVVLLIDTSPSTKYKIDEIHYAAVTFVNQLRPTDKVMVVAFDQRIKILTEEPTNEKPKLYAAIYQAKFGSGTSLYDAVSYAASLDLLNVTGRKAIVLFTDGVDTTSRGSNYESTVAAVQEVDALIYPIRYNTMTEGASVLRGPSGSPAPVPADIAAMLAARGLSIDPRVIKMSGGRGTSQSDYERGKSFLEALAVNTGGRMFDADSLTNLETSFAGVAEELRRQYSIGYYPENPGAAGERRSVKIKVARPVNAVVRAKNGYVIRGANTGGQPGT